MFGVKYGHFSFSAACIEVQYGTIYDLEEAFYDLIESIKIGHLCSFYCTALRCTSGQHNTRGPASPVCEHICSLFMEV